MRVIIPEHPITERMLNELVERDHIDTIFHKFSIIERTIDGVAKISKIEQFKVKEITEEGYVFTLVVNMFDEHEVNFAMEYSISVRENLEPGPAMATKEYHATGLNILLYEELGISITDDIRSEEDKYYPLVKRIRHAVGSLI
jgi:hypothetical protein